MPPERIFMKPHGAEPRMPYDPAMKTFLTLLTITSLGSAAAATDSSHLAGREDKAPGAPNFAMISDNDHAMERAVKTARHTLPFFVAVLRAKKADDQGFEIKKAFVDGDNVEHLWIGELTFDGKKFHGQINNLPRDVHNVRLGQSVTVSPREVTDWMFIKGGKLMGGYTTRVLFARLSPRDKALFSKEADFKIE